MKRLFITLSLFICITCLMCCKIGNHIMFYNDWAEFACESLWFCSLVAACFDIIRLSGNVGKFVKPFRGLLKWTMILTMWLSFLHLYRDASFIVAGLGLAKGHDDRIIQKRDCRNGIKVVLTDHYEYEGSGSSAVVAQIPIIENTVYREEYILHSRYQCTEDQLTAAIKMFENDYAKSSANLR